MPTEKEILTHMLRVAAAMEDGTFSTHTGEIDGRNAEKITHFFLRIHLDPWFRNNTKIGDVYFKSHRSWWYHGGGDDVKKFLGLEVSEKRRIPTTSGKQATIDFLANWLSELS